MLQNCGVQVFFASNDESTTNYISRRLGTMTVQVKSRSQSQDWSYSTLTLRLSAHDAPEEVRRLSEKRPSSSRGRRGRIWPTKSGTTRIGASRNCCSIRLRSSRSRWRWWWPGGGRNRSRTGRPARRAGNGNGPRRTRGRLGRVGGGGLTPPRRLSRPIRLRTPYESAFQLGAFLALLGRLRASVPRPPFPAALAVLLELGRQRPLGLDRLLLGRAALDSLGYAHGPRAQRGSQSPALLRCLPPCPSPGSGCSS